MVGKVHDRKEVNNMTKQILLSALVITVASVGLLSASDSFAQNNSTPQTSLVQKIADRFKLNKDEVQAVFDEVHEERHQQMQTLFVDRLTTYVTEGKITEAQKQLILQKREELATDRQDQQQLTPEERRTNMESKRQELKAWAEANGIDPQYLGGFGIKGHGMRGYGMHRQELGE